MMRQIKGTEDKDVKHMRKEEDTRKKRSETVLDKERKRTTNRNRY